MNYKDKIEKLVTEYRDYGITERLRVVPVVHKRCFVQCDIGRCNCVGLIDSELTLVIESDYEHAIRNYNYGLAYVQELVDNVGVNKDNTRVE